MKSSFAIAAPVRAYAASHVSLPKIEKNLKNNLVLYYSFTTPTNIVADASGKGNNGTVQGATWTAQGKIGGAYVFDGNGYINCITYSAWIKPNVLEDYRAIFGKGLDYVSTATMFYVKATGKLGCSVRANSYVSYDGTGRYTLTTGVWYHVAIVYDSHSGLKAYVNGRLDQSVAPDGALGTAPDLFYVGNYPTINFNRKIKATIDEVMVFNRALSENEIKQLAKMRR
ncbi:MAG: LamG domain-containing protein [Magnetococcus sp. WYHC-3]